MSTNTALPSSGLRGLEGPTAQTAIMILFGIYGLDEELWLSTKEVINALEPLGVSEDATRMTLARMSKKGFLTKRRLGRESFISVGALGRPVLEEGHSRVLSQDVLMSDWSGEWTHVLYTLPENTHARNLRRQLQSTLEWGGFGRLLHGAWIAPGVVDVEDLVAHIHGSDCVRAFTSVPVGATTHDQILREAFDLPGIAGAYEDFMSRWSSVATTRTASLHRRLLLHTEWLEVIRRTPILPETLVPADWPARAAQSLFKSVDKALAVELRTHLS